MRLYFEAIETPSDEFEENLEFIRVDITDMTDTEKADTLKAIKDVMVGKTYRLIEHTCYHDGDTQNTPCVMKDI